jgi:hypothetical protein
MLGTDKLVFDTTATLSDNSNVGAYLRSAAGTLLTHTTVGAKEALDVNVERFLSITAVSGLGVFPEDSMHVSGDAGQLMLVVRNDAGGSLAGTDGDYAPLQVDSTGRLRVLADFTAAFDFVYAEDSAHTTGDSGAFTLAVRNDARAAFTSADGDYSPFAVDASGRLITTADKAEDAAHGSGDFGNYVLAVRQDTLASSTSADGDYGSFKLNTRGGLWTVPVGTVADDAADSENPVKVGSRAETGALTAVSDGDRADLLSDDFRRVWVNSGANVSVDETVVSVTTTATALPATALTGRRKIYIQNLDNAPIFLGGSGVTIANGLRIAAGAVFEDEVGDDIGLFAIVSAGTAEVRILELA